MKQRWKRSRVLHKIKDQDLGSLFVLFGSHLLMHLVLLVAGESVDDCGGGYSESIAEMCDELQNSAGLLPLLTATPNGREEAGTSREGTALFCGRRRG